jgi:hypothetical protein
VHRDTLTLQPLPPPPPPPTHTCTHTHTNGRSNAAGRPGSRSSEARPALELAPPHLALAAAAGGGGRGARLHATYLAFGSRGDKVGVGCVGVKTGEGETGGG